MQHRHRLGEATVSIVKEGPAGEDGKAHQASRAKETMETQTELRETIRSPESD